MRNKEDQGYRNPAYIYDEGQTGGGPDTRSSASASSSSSMSSMKVIGTKLKGKGRRWYIWLAVIILIIIVIAVAVTVALVLTNKQNDGPSRAPINASRTDNLSDLTSPPPSTTIDPAQTTTTTIVKTTTVKSTPTTTEQRATTTDKTTTAGTTTARTTTARTTTTTKATTQTPTLSPLILTTRTTKDKVETTTTSQTTITTRATDATTTSTTTQPSTNATTTESNAVTNGNLTVSMSNILYYPGDVKAVTLWCNGHHQGDWKTITIRRQFKDSYEPVAVAVLNDNNEVEVFKFYPNVSHTIDIGENDVLLSIVFDPFECEELTNFTCAFANEFGAVTGRADISIYMPPPQITLPHSIVENSELALNCLAEVWGSSASLLWQFKPEYSTNFMQFSVEPLTNITRENCSMQINSTLVFNPTMYEDGAVFKCEIIDTYVHPQVIQTRGDEITFKVVPSNYCEGKRQFTLHPHPHGPCTLVVYCLDTAPLVYEIECEPGHCYDYVKTACVPA